ncbi:MAG: hypothetical protein L0Z62_36625 [Gemmataceae bacterium]|nr:hypothetical protein [Gemmataceae bacterium]
MTIILHLSPDTEKKLQDLAAQRGESVARFIERHVEELAQQANGGPALSRSPTWGEICAPLAAAVEGSAMTDDEFADFIEQVREEVWQEKQAQQGPSE